MTWTVRHKYRPLSSFVIVMTIDSHFRIELNQPGPQRRDDNCSSSSAAAIDTARAAVECLCCLLYTVSVCQPLHSDRRPSIRPSVTTRWCSWSSRCGDFAPMCCMAAGDFCCSSPQSRSLLGCRNGIKLVTWLTCDKHFQLQVWPPSVPPKLSYSSQSWVNEMVIRQISYRIYNGGN